jgi:hypothetical protein
MHHNISIISSTAAGLASGFRPQSYLHGKSNSILPLRRHIEVVARPKAVAFLIMQRFFPTCQRMSCVSVAAAIVDE